MPILRGLTGLSLAVLAMSFLGGWHPVGDSLSVFRPWLCGFVMILALIVGLRRKWRAVLFGVGLVGAATVMVHKLPVPSALASSLGMPGTYSLYQKNVFHRNSDLAALAEDIRISKADFVTLQEMSVANDRLLDLLKYDYPYQHLCRFKDRGGTAVLSRLEPSNMAPCKDAYATARITVDLEQGSPIDVMSVHLSWPYPGVQSRQLVHLLKDLEALENPVLIGGDFNMVPWSHALASVAKTSATRRVGTAKTTFLIGFLPISIDHVFAPGGGMTDIRPLLGSDHFGLRAAVRLKASDPKNPN